MAGLADIARNVKSVELSFGPVRTYGISLGSLGRLVERFPEFRKLASSAEGINAASLFSLGPEFVAAFLSAGTDPNWTDEDEAAASMLTLDDQAQLLLAILQVSMPRGPRPFVETVVAIMGAMGMSSQEPAQVSTAGNPKSGSTPPQPSSRSAAAADSRKRKH